MMQVMTCAEAYDLIYVSTVGCEGIIYDILANLIRFMAFEESKKKKKKAAVALERMLGIKSRTD